MKKKIKMKLFTDYICPWCYLGDAVVKNLKEDYDIEIDHIGFELHPDTAPEGNDLLKQFPGSDEMFDYLRERGKKYGLSFAHLTVLPNSRKALLVGEYAKEIGKNEAFVSAMWQAYFKDGKNIGEDQVIVDTAGKVGITEAEVHAAFHNKKYAEALENNMREGIKYGVDSVPTFIIEEQVKVVGARSEDIFKKALEELNASEDEEASGCDNGACRLN
ncbi:DsbA family oxidoreductase [Clostridium transplantifaecale]|uniref:DsbA family oxidoreductase n=1 Tax=Clostridium transplantifaecale TaxID=2479838 RepID=UPI000F642B2C|nr:DsbA family protein [Clostridium transplantifaecale]